MIVESYPYKKELQGIHHEIQKKIALKRFRKETFWAIEKSLSVSAYVIRKMLEAHKLSDEVRTLKIPAAIGRLKPAVFIDTLNNHRIFEKYNLIKTIKSQVSVKDLTNRLIHSFIFAFWFNDRGNKVVGFLLNSDKTIDQLYMILIENYLLLLENVFTDDVEYSEWQKKKKVLENGKLDLMRPRSPVKQKRGIYCQKIKKFNERYRLPLGIT